MSFEKSLCNILCALALVWLSSGCTPSPGDRGFVVEGEEQVGGDKQEILLPKEPKSVEIIVEDPVEPMDEALEPAAASEGMVTSPTVPGVASAIAPAPPIPPFPPPVVPVPLPPGPEDDFGDEEDDSDEEDDRDGEEEGGRDRDRDDDRDNDDGKIEAECRRDSECEDENPCTDEKCEDGKCEHRNNFDSCDDGKDCTFNDRCREGACNGRPRSSHESGEHKCENGFDDDCNGKVDCADFGCAGQRCVDGDPCTNHDACTNGKCQGISVTVGQTGYSFCDALSPCAYTLCTDLFVCATPTQLPNGTLCLLNCDQYPGGCAENCLRSPELCGCPGSTCPDNDPKKEQDYEDDQEEVAAGPPTCQNGFCIQPEQAY